ncbi:MAG: BPL-N domain-containing protein [Thermodesulfobacteriota bacterium]
MGSQAAHLLYSTGGLWSLWTFNACRAAGWDIAPIGAAEIAAGGLAGARVVVIPGGWPALKRAALGEAGAAAVRAFVSAGGAYLGFCGGAGLALAGADGLGLVGLGRSSGRDRLPSLSGPVLARPGAGGGANHPFWRNLAPPCPFHVWWPGQFAAPLPTDLAVVAAYAGPAPGLCSADLAVDQVDPAEWPALEKSYGLRLDPAGLAGLPAVVESGLDQGRVLLSYLHLDTPGDETGRRALANLWRGWLGLEPAALAPPAPASSDGPAGSWAATADELWRLGQDMGLWRPRHPVMPLWRRGARGLEFWSLCELCRALATKPGPAPAPKQAAEIGALMASLRRHGPVVLDWQARALAGEGAPPPPAAQAWFPAPRRVGGELARVLALLEQAIFAPRDGRR